MLLVTVAAATHGQGKKQIKMNTQTRHQSTSKTERTGGDTERPNRLSHTACLADLRDLISPRVDERRISSNTSSSSNASATSAFSRPSWSAANYEQSFVSISISSYWIYHEQDARFPCSSVSCSMYQSWPLSENNVSKTRTRYTNKRIYLLSLDFPLQKVIEMLRDSCNIALFRFPSLFLLLGKL